MILYLYMLLLIVIEGVVLLRRDSKRTSGLFFLLVWLELTLFAGLRSVNVGRDTALYFSTFNYMSHLPDLAYLSNYMERGFLLLCRGLSYIWDSPQVLFFTVGGIYTYVFLRFINKFSPWRLISVIIFFSAVPLGSYIFGMSFLRQALAISFVILGIEKLLENKGWLFVVFVLLGMIFHKSAVFCLVLWPLQKQKINWFTLALAFVGAISFMVLLPVILPHLPFGTGRYANYALREVGEISYLTAFIKAMVQLCICGTVLYVYFTKQDRSPTIHLFAWISIIAFVCEFSAIRILFMNRVLYFTVLNCVIIPYVLSHLKSKREFVAVTAFFIFLFTFNNLEFWMRRAEREHVDQYEFYWDNPRGLVRWNLYG